MNNFFNRNSDNLFCSHEENLVYTEKAKLENFRCIVKVKVDILNCDFYLYTTRKSWEYGT